MAETMVAGTTITPQLREWLLRELRFPVAATIGKDGMPSQSVVWFDVDPDRDDTILINTLAGRVKDRHLRRDPRISLCFEDGLEYVTIQGRAELTDDEGMAGILAMARRYGKGWGSFAEGHRINIAIRVEKVIWHR
jgi:PPOX class probable F420-dependent enzyme